MQSLTYLLTLVLLLSCQQHKTHSNVKAAGAVLYCQKDAEILLFLADHGSGIHSRRGWAGFGGGRDQSETVAEAAVRETEEETKGYFSRQTLLKTIKKQKPILSGAFAFYFIEIPYVDAEKITKHKSTNSHHTYNERGPYAWIPFSDVERCLKTGNWQIKESYLPQKRQQSYYWSTWIGNMKDAKEENQIPWK